jgi:ribosome-associated protein
MKDLVIESLDDDKALEIQVIALEEQLGLADHIVVASGTSTAHVVGLAEKLKARLHARGVTGVKMEGAPQGNWVIVDAGDVIIHLFRPEVREFYNIEKMWTMSATSTAPTNASSGDFQLA